jgi:transposase
MLSFFANLPSCEIGMEACGGAHYWARELTKMGHQVRLMAPQFVKPYVKTNKNDAADAEAICEALGRPGMRFVPIKTAGQQAAISIHRVCPTGAALLSALLAASAASVLRRL